MDIKKAADEMVDWIKKYFATTANENTKCVIGVSGGKDSSCVVAAAVKALGKDRVIGVMMPNSIQSDIEDSKRICEIFGIENYTVNIGDAYTALTETIATQIYRREETVEMDGVGNMVTPGCPITPQYATNTPARLRMATLYGVAAMIGNCRVANTCNLSEDLVGYSTLYGDSAGDFAPLSHLYVDEVMAIAEYLGVPHELAYKTPSDGMCGKSDEDNLGFTYDEIKQVHTGNYTTITIETAKKVQNRTKAYGWKIQLQNLPSYVPFERNPEAW